MIYKGKIETENKTEIYIRLSANRVKKKNSYSLKTTINSKSKDKSYFQYVQATELLTLTHKLRSNNKNHKLRL